MTKKLIETETEMNFKTEISLVLVSVTPGALPSHQHHCNVHKWRSLIAPIADSFNQLFPPFIVCLVPHNRLSLLFLSVSEHTVAFEAVELLYHELK